MNAYILLHQAEEGAQSAIEMVSRRGLGPRRVPCPWRPGRAMAHTQVFFFPRLSSSPPWSFAPTVRLGSADSGLTREAVQSALDTASQNLKAVAAGTRLAAARVSGGGER